MSIEWGIVQHRHWTSVAKEAEVILRPASRARLGAAARVGRAAHDEGQSMTKTKTTKAVGKKLKPTVATIPVRKGKLGTLIALLSRPEGASLAQMQDATGWQAHSLRGAMSGSIKKKLGLTVVSEMSEVGRIYRIADGAA
jgi:hypothetical protein